MKKKTSPKIKNFNQRGKRDMLSAKFISQRDGYRFSYSTIINNWLRFFEMSLHILKKSGTIMKI